VKHAAMAFSSVAFSLNLLLAGVVAAQSAPPRKDIPAIAKAANGVIVSIITSDKDGHPVAQGTGFLASKDGRIVTNYHVIKGASSAIVKLPDGAFYDVDGVVAFDKARDLAVIKAHGQNFRVATLGNSDRVQVGDEIVAIGSPLSLESTVSSGIVSGIRTIKEEGGKFLQITAPISPGSSGGPLFNMAGEVVGITTLYLKGGENLNFAIPVNDAKLLLSAGSKVRDFPVETSDPLADLGTPATPNAAPSPSVRPTAARAYYKQLYDAGGFVNAGGFARNLVDFVCFDGDSSSESFFAFGAIAASIQSSAPYVKVFPMKPEFYTAYPDGRMLEVLFYQKGVMTGSATYNGVKGWENNWVVEESLKSGKIKSSISIEPTTMRYIYTLSTFEPNVAPLLQSGVCEKIPIKQSN
jgi:hypothetical protein